MPEILALKGMWRHFMVEVASNSEIGTVVITEDFDPGLGAIFCLSLSICKKQVNLS